MAGLPTQPERQGGMSDCGRLPMCCAVASARGGREGGGAVLCLAGPGSPRGVASGCWELGWEAPSLHVTVQSHPDGPPKAQPGLSFRAPGEGGPKPADGHPTPPPKLECQRSQGWGALHEAASRARRLRPRRPSVGLVPLPSVCSVPVGGRPAGPGVAHTPGTLTSLSLPLPRLRFFSPPDPGILLHLPHHSLSLSAFIFISFFLFFLCAPSRGAVTEEKGPATWE